MELRFCQVYCQSISNQSHTRLAAQLVIERIKQAFLIFIFSLSFCIITTIYEAVAILEVKILKSFNTSCITFQVT